MAQPNGQAQTQPPEDPDAAAVAAVLAVVGAGYVGTAAAGKLASILRPFRISPRATMAAWELAFGKGIIGGPYPRRSARSQTVRLQLQRSARYLIQAAKRLQLGINQGRLREALAAERRWAVAHLQAQRNRQRAAATVDAEAAIRGLVLGWHARNDKITSRECRAAHGRNFRADQMPAIGYPGMVHPHCRCVPGPAWPSGAMMVRRPRSA